MLVLVGVIYTPYIERFAFCAVRTVVNIFSDSVLAGWFQIGCGFRSVFKNNNTLIAFLSVLLLVVKDSKNL